MKPCPSCGHMMQPAYRYCAMCGSALEKRPSAGSMQGVALTLSAGQTAKPSPRFAKRGRIRRFDGNESGGAAATALLDRDDCSSGELPVLPLSPLFQGWTKSLLSEGDEGAENPEPSRKGAQFWTVCLIGVLALVCAVGLATESRTTMRYQPPAKASAAGMAAAQPTVVAAAVSRPSDAPAGILLPQTTLAPMGKAALRRDSERYYVADGVSNVVGQVTNVSGRTLTMVDAVTTFYDRSGAVVSTAEAVLPVQALAPGQSSPFHVAVTAAPLIAGQATCFTQPGGGKLAVVLARALRNHHKRRHSHMASELSAPSLTDAASPSTIPRPHHAKRHHQQPAPDTPSVSADQVA